MGLAGRDPIFHAQVESEIRLDPRRSSGPTRRSPRSSARRPGRHLPALPRGDGQAAVRADHPDGGASSRSTASTRRRPGEHAGRGAAKYGALARDGVGCVVCHRMQPRPSRPDDRRPYLQYFLETSITGNFHLGEKGEIYGPFRDDEIAPYAMEHATGLKPKHSEFLKSSQLCGTCHTVALPTVDKPLDEPELGPRPGRAAAGRDGRRCSASSTTTSSRRPTWSGSTASTRTRSTRATRRRSRARTATWREGLKDERHGIDVPQIRTRIAAIQDTTYPEAENLAPHDRLNVRVREDGYRRHNFAGLNAFLLELFRQFDDVLGRAARRTS